MSCSLSSISNRTDGFGFAQLLPVYQFLNATCPPQSEIFFPGTRMLTDITCKVITGTGDSMWSGWTPYPIEDIWTRMVTWKLPLFQLVSQFPRSPLGLSVETMTIVHLLGDPVDSITSMLLSLAMCRSRAELAKQVCFEDYVESTGPDHDRTWKALAIMMISYDECGRSGEVEDFIEEYRHFQSHLKFEDDIRNKYEKTAACLAADRQTKSLPVFVAELIFLGGWLIALLKAASAEPSPTNWPNVEIHSIAISGLYLWVTSTVIIGCVMGASQTETSIPRLLQRFENDISEYRSRKGATGPTSSSRKVGQERAIQGGLNSWRPTKWTKRPRAFGVSTWALVSFIGIAMVAVSASFLAAILLSYFVPPRGLSCRHIPETLIFVLWLLSFTLECCFERWLQTWIFWSAFGKDLFFALSNIAIVIVTQWGIMNRCSCWSMWGLTGLHLPQLPEVRPELMNYMRHEAVWITLMAILFQFVFCGAVAWKYWDAVRVYIQRDDGASNREWGTRKSGATKQTL